VLAKVVATKIPRMCFIVQATMPDQEPDDKDRSGFCALKSKTADRQPLSKTLPRIKRRLERAKAFGLQQSLQALWLQLT